MFSPSVSFCIISNGLRPASLEETISSIRKLNIPDYEIFVSGEAPTGLEGVIIVDAVDAAREGRLGEMRNKATCLATKEIIVVCDDDILFQEDFYQGICDFGPNFDLLCVRILNTDGTRYWDWAVVNAPTGHHLIDYTSTSPFVYITGGLCVMKKYVSESVKWPNDNGFYEGEDVNFSEEIKKAGFSIKMNAKSTVIHNDIRMTQLGPRIIKLDIPEKWQLHNSGCKIFGANPGSSNRFTVTNNFIIEVPCNLFQEELVINATLSLDMPIHEFNNSQNVVTFLNNKELGTFQFNDSYKFQSIKIVIPRNSYSSIIQMKSDLHLPSYWLGKTISKSLVSFTVNDLSMETISGRKIRNYSPEIKANIREIEKSLNRKQNMKGGTLFWPVAKGNPYTRVLRSLARYISEECPDVTLRANLADFDYFKEIKESTEETKYWLNLLQRNASHRRQIDLVGSSSHCDINSKNILKSRYDLESINGILLEDFESVSYDNGLFGFALNKDKSKEFLPLSLDINSLSLSDLNFKLSDSKKYLIGLEIDSQNLNNFALSIAALHKLNRSVELEYVVFQREKNSENANAVSAEAINLVIETLGIRNEDLPEVNCFQDFLDDREIGSVYKSCDLLIMCASRSSFANCLLPLAFSTPILIVGEAKDRDILKTEYAIGSFSISSDFKSDIVNLSKYLGNILSNLEDFRNLSTTISEKVINDYDSKKIAPYWTSFLNSL